MSGAPQAAVTPVGVRDGDPAALTGLVARRGSAVLAFCEAVCEPDVAPRAAAEAFARFRAAVAAAPDPNALDPEALLLGATRHAGAAMARTATGGGGLRGFISRRADRQEPCAAIPMLLAARAEDMLTDADSERLARHLERCPACREVEAAFRRAERAYRSPPRQALDEDTEHLVLVALAGAAPLVAPGSEALLDLLEHHPHHDDPHELPDDWVDHEDEEAEDDHPAEAHELAHEPRGTHDTQQEPLAAEPEQEPLAAEPEQEPLPADPEPAAMEPEPVEPEPEPTVAEPEPFAPEPDPEPEPAATEREPLQPEPDPEPTAIEPEPLPPEPEPYWREPEAEEDVTPGDLDHDDEPVTAVFGAVAPEPDPVGPAPTEGGAGLPRTRRHLHLPHPHLAEAGVLYRFVLPAAAVAVAAIIILAIAGVFGGDGPAPTVTRVPPPATVEPTRSAALGTQQILEAAQRAERRAEAARRRRARQQQEGATTTPSSTTTPDAQTTPSTTTLPPASAP